MASAERYHELADRARERARFYADVRDYELALREAEAEKYFRERARDAECLEEGDYSGWDG